MVAALRDREDGEVCALHSMPAASVWGLAVLLVLSFPEGFGCGGQ